MEDLHADWPTIRGHLQAIPGFHEPTMQRYYEEGPAKTWARMEEDPWFLPVMRRMIAEEVHRIMGFMHPPAVAFSFMAAPACRGGARGTDGRAAANGRHD